LLLPGAVNSISAGMVDAQIPIIEAEMLADALAA